MLNVIGNYKQQQMIYPCRERDFLNNINEINSFIFAKNKHQEINNSERLINLLRTYFSTLLFYRVNSKGKFIVQIKGKLFEVKFGGTNENGDNQILDIYEAKDSILKSIFKYLIPTINLQSFEKLQDCIISILETQSIAIIDKLFLLNEDEAIFSGINDSFFFNVNEIKAFEAVNNRITVIYDFLSQKEYQAQIENIESIYKKLDWCLKLYLKNCICRGNLVEGLKFIEDELERFDSIDEEIKFDENNIVYTILSRLISYNLLFQLKSKEQIKEVVDDYIDFLSPENSKIIYENLNFNPNNFSIGKFDIGLAEPYFSEIDEDKILTYLIFTVQLKTDFQNFDTTIDSNTISFKKISNLIDDPIFNLLFNLDLQINGMPLAIFSDAIGNIHNSYTVQIEIPKFYHPDFVIENNKIVYTDHSIEEAKRGGKFYPHKDFIVELFLKMKNEIEIPFELETKDINSNIVSNYLVSYVYNGKNIHHHAYTITNFNSYFEVKKKYFERINQFEFEESSDINDFIFNTEILNHKQFHEFCFSLITKTVKRSIELGGMYRNLWDAELKKPISEPLAQRLLFNQLRYLTEIKGINISRETVAANGSLDFFFQYTKDSKALRVCVELKNAHHEKADCGNNTQLIEYIKDTGYKQGIYLVLWYKGKNFEEPKNYSSIELLQKKLDDNPTDIYLIKNLIIDCSIEKVSPSRLK
jgi:hypothetical protein